MTGSTWHALVRRIPTSFADALAAVAPEPPIDVALAREHHAAYCATLAAMGVTVTELAADDAYPDCNFVEDTAIVAAGIALITRPGAPSRRGETAAVATALAPHLALARMASPATFDGGDCLRIGATLYVGRSARTNAAGLARLAEVFAPHGLTVVPIDLPAGVLHLKCVVSPLGGDQILLARETVPAAAFPGADIQWVPPSETYAANVVAVGRQVLVADGYPRTRDVLDGAGFVSHPVPVSEVRKADGSLTCQSIIWPVGR